MDLRFVEGRLFGSEVVMVRDGVDDRRLYGTLLLLFLFG